MPWLRLRWASLRRVRSVSSVITPPGPPQFRADVGLQSGGPLLAVGIGNGLALVPLTGLSLSGVEHRDAGAASGLNNVTQQVGGALGLAVLVTVLGTASRSAMHSAAVGSADAVQAAFVHGADRAFRVSASVVLDTLLRVATAVKGEPRLSKA